MEPNITLEQMGPGVGLIGLIPMIIFGCLYVVLIVAFIWGFFSMVTSQKRIAAAQEETARAVREIAGTLTVRRGGGGLEGS